MNKDKVFELLNLQPTSGTLVSKSPIDGQVLGKVRENTVAETEQFIINAVKCFKEWRNVPAPKRGELIRLFGEELRAQKEALGTLVTLENGKILQEGLGEVQEMIDICDFAVGLSRQLYGLTIASERPQHRMMETWHPLGPIGIISPFNFPVAVWCWNFALAIVCGDPVVWKPSEKTPLTALACANLFERAVKRFGKTPPHLLQMVIGGSDLGKALVDSPALPLYFSHRQHRHGPSSGHSRCQTLWSHHPGIERQQWYDPNTFGRPRTSHTRHRLCSPGYSRTTLHEPEAPVCT